MAGRGGRGLPGFNPAAGGRGPPPRAPPVAVGQQAPVSLLPLPQPSGQDAHQKESSEIYQGAEENDINLVQQGITGGGDINVSNLQGVTPLLIAVKNQNLAMVTLLLKAGADPNRVNADGSPIHEAVRKHNVQVLGLLLDSKGNVNLPADNGKTPIMIAVQLQQMELIDYLLKRNADPRLKNDSGVTCLHFAASGDRALMEKFVQLGVGKDDQNANGKSALHVAAELNNSDAIKVLLNAGANPKLKDSWGRLAEECGKVTAYKLLHNHKPGQKYEFAEDFVDEEVDGKKKKT